MKQSLHARRMERRHRRGKSTAKLNLVSLMDIFTILVFFLLVNSSDVEVLQNNKDIQLPESVAEKKPETTLVVMVTRDNIIINGRAVVSVAEALESDEQIAPLNEELEYLAARKPYQSEAEREKGRDVTIMADAEIPYRLMKKIMTTAAQADYRNISLAVSQMAEDEPSLEAGG